MSDLEPLDYAVFFFCGTWFLCGVFAAVVKIRDLRRK